MAGTRVTAGAPYRGRPRAGPSSESGVTLGCVEVSAEAVAKVPVENLRVSQTEFGVVWALAEHLGGQPGDGGEYLLGVILTCEWMADQPVPSVLPSRVAEMPRSPLTRRLQRPMPETIESELLAAYARGGGRPQLARGVASTLEWAWRGKGRPPLDVSQASAR
jgi:hypothetical protein